MAIKKNMRKDSPKSKKSASVKKAAGTKKTTGVQKAPKKLSLRAPEEHVFFCNDGHLFYDLKELAEGLMTIDEATFSYHVHGGNNDFSNWVRDIIQDIELADDLARADNTHEAAKYVLLRLEQYD